MRSYAFARSVLTTERIWRYRAILTLPSRIPMVVCCPQAVSARGVRQSGLHLNLGGFCPAVPLQAPPLLHTTRCVAYNLRRASGRGRLTSTTMPKTIKRWVLFEYVGLECTPLSKPFKTKNQAEKARRKYPERERRRIGVGVVGVPKDGSHGWLHPNNASSSS